jgi:hypothetical protein
LLVLRARATPLTLRLMPAWAVVCGTLASGAPLPARASLVRLIVTLLLVDLGWGTLWAAIGGTNWASPVNRWRQWPIGGTIRLLPFTRPGSSSDRLSQHLGRLRAWWRQDLWPACGDALLSITIGLVITGFLAAVLGPAWILLSLAAFATIQLGAVIARGAGTAHPVPDAAVVLILPWLAGAAGAPPITPTRLALPAVLGVAYGASRAADRRWPRAIGPLCIAAVGAILLTTGQPIPAVAACGLMLPPLLVNPWVARGFPGERAARYARSWLMLAMLVSAIATYL